MEGRLYDAFKGALKDLGYVEGRDLSIEPRWGGNRSEQLPGLAAEAVARNPDVIVTAGSGAVAALKKATSSIPIVFATVGNPVEQGFVSSLSRPGGNVTGVALHVDMLHKVVEIAREALPAGRRLALLIHEPDPFQKFFVDMFEPSAGRQKFQSIVVRVTRVEDLDRAFSDLRERRADAVIAPSLTFLGSNHSKISELALKARIPLFSTIYTYAGSGALLTYATPPEENYRRAAALVDKILRGAKPGDLPVEQPDRFHLILNRKTAKAIGVELPSALMLRAERIID